jgi:hypothetical protein
MAYDIELDELLNKKVSKYKMEKKNMFGGTCYLENEKMVCGIWKDNIILRLGEEEGSKFIKEKKAAVFDITGKAMKGWVMINKKKIIENELNNWIELARNNVNNIKKKK